MPVVPEFDNEVAVHAVPAPTADANAFGKVGAAAAQGFGELSDQMANFNQRYIEARRQADAANTVAATSKALGDLQFKWSKVPDRQKASDGYAKESQALIKSTLDPISDPYLKSYVTERIAPEATTRGLETQSASFALESNMRRGQLRGNLDQFSQSAAAAGSGATGDALRAKLTDDGLANIHGAVAAGWMTPEEGKEHEIAFRSNIQRVRVEQLVNHAISTQNPNEVAALAKAVNDPASFEGLLPQERETLGQHLENLSYRIENRAIARQAHADAVAERSLHQAQSHNEAVILAGIYSGKTVDDATMEKWALGQQISPTGMEAIHSAQIRQNEGSDDERVTVPLWHAIGTGQATSNDVLGAMTAGKIKGTTGAEMMKALDRHEPSANEKNNFQLLKTAMHGQAIEMGSLDAPTSAAQWTQAQGEWHRRVSGGENPDAVLADMMPRYASNVTKPTWLATPKFGGVNSSKDLGAVAIATVKARDAGQLDDNAYGRQVQLLNSYRRFYTLEENANAARAAAAAKARKASGAGNSGGVNP